jgi:pimeloyl-ACP methyl ester carboxylesterase
VEYQDALMKAGFEGPGKVDFKVIKQNAGPGWVEKMRNAHPNPDPDYYRKLLKQISEMWWTPLNYSEEDFRKIFAPTLILMGERDEMIPVSEARELAQLIPGAELVIIPSATHNDVLQEGGKYMEIVINFLLKHHN